MSVPGKRKSRSKRKTLNLMPKKNQLTACPECKQMIMPHRVCPFCGKYQGAQVIEIKLPKGKKTGQEDKKEKK